MKNSIVNKVFIDPTVISGFTLEQWDVLLRQLKTSNLTGSFFEILKEQNLTKFIPEKVQWHFNAIENVTKQHLLSVRFEILELQNRLAVRGFPIVLLKGGAYVASGLIAHRGRLFSDIDIMVPKQALNEVENILKKQGWGPTHLNEYDQKYYREWSHELPPLQHYKRRTVLDIHYTIIPPTASPKPSDKQLLADAIPVEGYEEIYTLSPLDMVIHSATHLFYDGELDHGLRDIVDLHNLITEFSANNDHFWVELIERAKNLELSTPVFYALRYIKLLLKHPVPDSILIKSQQLSGIGTFKKYLMDIFFTRALQPDHKTASDWLTGFARWFLFVRSHYIKMPLYMLVPHLIYKGTIAKHKEQKETNEFQKQKDFFAQLK